MSRILVVGSGASGVHFALTALERGHHVTLLDVGLERVPAPLPEASFSGLKSALADPVAYFVGARGEGVVFPAPQSAYYAHPPSKHYVFDVPKGFGVRASVMEPRFSFARGGFAEAWTAGAYAFNRDDLAEFPFGYEELARCYADIARRIGIGAERDDLERFIPLDPGDGIPVYLPPLPLDPHSRWLWDRYHARRETLQRRFRFYLGRSRVATLSRDHAGRKACSQLGRCLWGCPTDSIYTPLATLEECRRHPRFQYLPGLLVRHFEFDETGLIRKLVARRLADGQPLEFEVELVALAAGALLTSRIVLDSLFRRTGRIARLGGLMDNRQVHVPFLTPARLGRSVETASYQFHHLAFGIERATPRDYVHGQITTLKAASVHPIVQSLPLDLRGGLGIFRAMRAGLGVVNLNLADRRRPDSHLSIRPLESGGSDQTELLINYVDDPGEAAELTQAVRILKRALRALGCLVPPGMTRVWPKGSSVHYAGTLPMSATRGEFTCAPSGRSHDFPNLYIVDGAGFPFLPAKNLTFTLMANATRIARGL